MQVIAHYGIRVDTAGEDIAEFQNTFFDPWLTVFKASLGIAVKATQPGSAHTAMDAVIGASVIRIDKLAAGLGHFLSLLDASVVSNQTSLSFGSDYSWK
jgi:hypothetical protein